MPLRDYTPTGPRGSVRADRPLCRRELPGPTGVPSSRDSEGTTSGDVAQIRRPNALWHKLPVTQHVARAAGSPSGFSVAPTHRGERQSHRRKPADKLPPPAPRWLFAPRCRWQQPPSRNRQEANEKRVAARRRKAFPHKKLKKWTGPGLNRRHLDFQSGTVFLHYCMLLPKVVRSPRVTATQTVCDCLFLALFSILLATVRLQQEPGQTHQSA